MFDMFDSIKRGWLIKLIEVVEAVEEDAIDAIVEDEDGIAVEAICSVGAIYGSDTMKKQVRFAQTSVFSIELYGMNNAWRERSKEKKIEIERERELRISEKEKLNYDSLEWIKIQYITLIYKWIYT